MQPPARRVVDVAAAAGLKKRMRIFVEAIVKMVSPVFLAACVSLAKLEYMQDQPKLRDSFSPLAGCSVTFGLLSLLPLTFPNWFPHRLYPYRFSMFCINLCGVLLMVVAYLALVLTVKRYTPMWSIVAPVAGFTLCCGMETVRKGTRAITAMSGECLDALENSVDFVGATTFLLFLGLGGLMLGGTIQQDEQTRLLLLIMYLSLFCCISGVYFMLLVGMVPPDDDDGDEQTCLDNFHLWNNFFGCFLALIVLLITHGKLRCWYASTLALLLSVLPLAVWVFNPFRCGAIERGDHEEVKPASLDLTKVNFTGFAAISIYTVRQNNSVHECSTWFMFFTAVAVNNCLGWRLLTLDKRPSAATFTAANFASLCAHAYVTAAAILFAFMASAAFKNMTSK